MQVLKDFKRNGFFGTDIYCILLGEKKTQSCLQMTPSIYLRELQLSSYERLPKLCNLVIDNIKGNSDSKKNAVLSFCPKLLLFQNFQPNVKIIAKFTVKNISQASTYINMIFKESSNFFIKPGGTKTSRLAPGISLTFTVTFIPGQYEDNTHKVSFLTDTDKYILPIIALGPRPLFDLPDMIVVSQTPLKIENSCTITVSNIGQIPAGFSLNVKCPFYANPKSAYLCPGEKTDLTVSFKSMHLGEFYGTLIVSYETGETLGIRLKGSTYSVKVHLEKQTVRFIETYNSMLRQLTVKIYNDSPHLLSYMCMRYEDVHKDFEKKLLLAASCGRLRESEAGKACRLSEYEVVSSPEHERVYSRLFQDELHSLVADETFLFQDTHFSVEPLRGKLWPNTSADLTITFTPKSIGEFEAVLYLDIDGVEGRLPMELIGTSLPPSIKLNVETLDMDRLYINRPYLYELVAMNKGHINGVLVYKEAPVLFGSRIACTPELHCLEPGGMEVFIISFLNPNQGPYFEEIHFNIRDTNIILKVYLKGEILFPSLSFSTTILDFGMVSLGIPKTMEFQVMNESTIEVNVDLGMFSDGPEVNSVSLTDYEVSDVPKPTLPEWPKEFQIVPCKAMIDPESHISVKVTLTANLVRANQTSIEVELENADSPPLLLPIRYNAKVPEIRPKGDIHLKACFLEYGYNQDIIFTSNEFIGYYVLESETDPAISLTIQKIEGYVEPNSVTSIPVTLKTSLIGLQTATVRMRLFGLSKPIDICTITVCGVKPIITYSPLSIHWGHVKLLTKVERTITLINDSPVPVDFDASLLNDDDKLHVNITKGQIAPESSIELILRLYLIDADFYQNKLHVKVDHLKDITMPLTAVGIGTSIVVGELRDHVVLGRHFTKIPMNCVVVVENNSTRHHTMEWTTQYKPGKMKIFPEPFFHMEPSQFKMAAGEKLDLKVTALTTKPLIMKETWYLIGSVEGINKKELLMMCPVEAEFVDPNIEVSTEAINLRYDYGPYSEHYNLTDIFTIKNVSKLPLELEVSVRPPFAFVQRTSSYIIDADDEPLCQCICYNTSDLNIDALMHESEPYVAKLFIDYLTKRPVPPIRKDYLKFFQEINKLKTAFNLTHLVNEVLEDEEAMRIQIVFDTTKHVTLKSKQFTDLVRIKFKKHKNEHTFEVNGEINFPNLTINPPKVDFQCIQNGSLQSKCFKISNQTPLSVCYEFHWRKFAVTEPETYASPYHTELDLPMQSSTTGSSKGDDLREILACRTPAGSLAEKLSTKVGDGDKADGRSASQRDPDGSCSTMTPHVIQLRNEKTALLQTITPLLEIDKEERFEWLHKFPKLPLPQEQANELFHITPHRGTLKPGESGYVHVAFSPDKDVKIKALLECKVLGGPTEALMVLGSSSYLNYALNTVKLDFQIRPYHEKATEELSLLNSALLSFDYFTYFETDLSLRDFDAKILALEPSCKFLAANEEVKIKVIIEPGIMGGFKRSFLLEIGHLKHIEIDVLGWGVIPQVYLSLQRPGVVLIPPEIGYRAIASLSSQYLGAVNSLFEQHSPNHLNTPLTEDIFIPDLDNANEWYICKEWDEYPSVMDAELAIERILVIDYISERPGALKNMTDNKSGPIPGFFTTPYVIEYGVVIIGTTVLCTTEIVNYGPSTTRLRLAKKNALPTWLELKLGGRMLAGERSQFEVIFSPTSEDFTELEEAVETKFHLEVPFGVSIPVIVKAITAVPYLVTNTKIINYGNVRCGDKVICSIPLKNIGKSTCIWYVTLKLKQHGPNPLTILNSSGKFEPGEGGLLDIAFRPNLEMMYEGLLLFRFYMNPNKLAIPIVGHGVLPRAHIIGSKLNFPPTLPWAETTDLFFGLTNPCAFPIELIFAHDDEKWKEEDDVYQMLNKYYDKPEEMLVPAIKPGCGLPLEVTQFYKRIMDKVKSGQHDDIMTGSISARSTTTPRKPPKKTTKSLGKPSVLKIRTEAEIMADELETLKADGVDPLREALQVYSEKLLEKEATDDSFGVIIFLHGSPYTETQSMELAYSIGKRLNLPVVNIDNAIVEALCTMDNTARNALMNIIDEMYDTCVRAAMAALAKANKTSELVIPEETEVETNEDQFDVVLKKLDYIGNSKIAGTPRSKSGDKKKKKSPSSGTVESGSSSMALLPTDILFDLMKDFFMAPRFEEGFVVDTLTSIVLKQPAHALTTLIKCKPRVKTIKLLVCHSDFTKWVQMWEDKERAAEQLAAEMSRALDETETEQLVRKYNEMDASEYENAPPEFKSIYINFGLEERRNKFLEKRPSGRKPINIKVQSQFRSVTALEASSTRRRRDETMTITSSKKADLKGAKLPSEYLLMNMRFNDYQKNTFEQLINIANNWSVDDCELIYPLLNLIGQPVGNKEKKGPGKKSGKSEVQLHLSELEFTDRGFPLILVTCPCKQLKAALLNFMAQCPLLKRARVKKAPVDILTLPVNCMEYTVLIPKVFPNLQHVECLQWKHLDELPIKKCECNPLKELQELDDTTPDNVVNILSMWHCTCGKKVISSSTSTTEIPQTSMEHALPNQDLTPEDSFPQLLHSVRSVHGHNKRIVLQPGDLLRCKYSFSPQLEGTYSVKRFVEVCGWPNSRSAITITGVCDLPRLDNRPKKVFSMFVRRTLEDVVYKSTYLNDHKVFEFGPIFVGAERVYEESAVFNIKNASLITCKVNFIFLDDMEVFKLDNTYLCLEPGTKDELKLLAAPSVVGQFSNKLLCCVQDNPEIVKIRLSCSGVVPEVVILPASKLIDYGKLLLYRREDERFIVRNDSILPIMWKIRNADEFLEHFIIAETSGIVHRNDNQVIAVTYIACEVGIITNKALIIDIYDELGRGEPMLTDTLFLSAECYDVLVDCAFENADDQFLDYGNAKVNSRLVKDMYLLNRGKYNIFYKIRKVKKFPEPSLLKSMEISKECGVIPPTMKLIDIQFYCTPTTHVNLHNVPAFICSLIDDTVHQTVVSKYPICLSIASYYNTFNLFPFGELNFHVIPMGVISKKEIIISNTSKCPITYEIELPDAYQGGTSATSLVKDAKGKDAKKQTLPGVKCGNFSILNEDSILAPGASRTIEVQFFAAKPERFEEIIKFIVSDTCPAEATGVPLTLVGTGAIPVIDIWNLDTTFREHLMLKNLNDYKVRETSPHCVFIEDSVTLYFFCVTVNSIHTANIDLYNSGLVSSALTMSLQYQENSDSSIFYLDKYSAHIEPLVHRTLGIVFAPKALEEYRAVLEIRLKLLQNQEEVYKICIIGEGVIPRISILEPRFKELKTSSIHFPATFLNTISSKPIMMTNICSVRSSVIIDVKQSPYIGQPPYWLTVFDEETEQMLQMYDSEEFNLGLKLVLLPKAIATVHVCFTPSDKGKSDCQLKVLIVNNPYEYFTILCDGEAFIEDVTLTGIDMLPMDYEVDVYRPGTELESLTGKESTGKKSTKSPQKDPKKDKDKKGKAPKKGVALLDGSQSIQDFAEPAVLKYALDLGGCELNTLHRRTAIMVNHSLKVYKFVWHVIDNVSVKPATGYISPGEEKDIEINFLSNQVIAFEKVNLYCNLNSLDPSSLLHEERGSLWDSRQTITVFERIKDVEVHKRSEEAVEDPSFPVLEGAGSTVDMVIVLSATVEYTQYTCSQINDVVLKETLMYQTRHFDFDIENIGNVPVKIAWSFHMDEDYPARIDIENVKPEGPSDQSHGDYKRSEDTAGTSKNILEMSEITLFSDSETRDSADTWFEMQLPFEIVPPKDCISVGQKRTFRVIFAPTDAFNFKVRLKSFIVIMLSLHPIFTVENLDPEDMNISIRIEGKSVVPYCHLDVEESDYLTAGRRKATLPALPPNTKVVEFNVLGAGCYKKKVNLVNPTSESYEFMLEMMKSDTIELVPIHCNKLVGFVDSGSTTEMCFTFSPTAPGTYESMWKFTIAQYGLAVDLLVVGIVREPDVFFVPTILTLNKTLVGGSTTSVVRLRNRENECVTFKITGNSLCNESGKQPVIIVPETGIVNAMSETNLKVTYKPIDSGNLSFKIFCEIPSMVKPLALFVNTLSHLVKPKVLYYLTKYEHVLQSDAVTHINIEKVASHYERMIRFVVKNEGSIAFLYRWEYVATPVKKYMDVEVKPREGRVLPGDSHEMLLCFTIRDVPVVGYPVTLIVSDGPEYNIFLHAEINKPLYTFNFAQYDFGKCIINAPDTTYVRYIVFTNEDSAVVTLDMNFTNVPEMFVEFHPKLSLIQPKQKMKMPVYFRPKHSKEYEFVLPFRINSLCEHNITIKGEGVLLLFDLYEGCQKNVDLGAVQVGDRIVREVEVMNHSRVPINATFLFMDTHAGINLELDDTDSQVTSQCLSPTAAKLGHVKEDNALSRVQMLKMDKGSREIKEQSKDLRNSLSSLKVTPSKATILPHQKIPLKIVFKPTGLIRTLKMQLCMKVFTFTKPLVKLSGYATGMSLCFSQYSMQFGLVRKHGCKTLKMMLLNNGDIGTRFCWQPLASDVFTIKPMEGTIASHTSVTFSISFKPTYNNPFVKTWVSCTIENYHPLELALYGSCLDLENYDVKTVKFKCPVRSKETIHISISNATDDLWQVTPAISGDAFETVTNFNVEPSSSVEVPIIFKPRTLGEHSGTVLYSPLGEGSLYFVLSGTAEAPQPNGICELDIFCKESFTETLHVYNLTESPETYVVQTEIMKIDPPKFSGYYEINCPKIVNVWGEATAPCKWTIVVYEECTMHFKVHFINQETSEYQFYFVVVRAKPCSIVATFEMSARARESAQQVVSVRNPLSEDIPFMINCNNPDITYDFMVTVSRKSEAKFTITYSPLVVGATEDYVEAGHPLVGVYVYRLALVCLPAAERRCACAAPLGTSAPLRLRVRNGTDRAADFACTTTNSSFVVDKMYSLGPYEKGKMMIRFEPTNIGLQTGQIRFKSPTAGEFVFNMEGAALEPKPQGPVEVKAGGSSVVLFKNVFEETRTFKTYVDRDEFSIRTMFETVKPKKDLKLTIYLSKLPAYRDTDTYPTGTLTVECHEPAQPRLHWTYFLQGIP